MRHRSLLIGSILAIAAGSYMWDYLGPMISVASGGFAGEGLWLRNLSVTAYTKPFWTGLMTSLIGFIILLAGAAGVIIVLFLFLKSRNGG